jgi:hypothetical protein
MSFEVNTDEIVHRFTNHPPLSPTIGEKLDNITEEMIVIGAFFVSTLPECREKSLAITKLEEASMWAKAAVARNQ